MASAVGKHVVLWFHLAGFLGYASAVYADLPVLAPSAGILEYDSAEGKTALAQPTQEVPVADIKTPAVQNLIASLTSQMRASHGGVGLSANQLGVARQVAVIEHRYSEAEKLVVQALTPEQREMFSERGILQPEVPYQVFINPVITAASAERVSFWHGCLSATQRPLGKVATYRSIRVRFFDADGEQKEVEFAGMAAIIFQHEFRHLLGGLYHDHAQETLSQEALMERVQRGQINASETCGPEVPHLLADYQVGETIAAYAARRQ